MPKTSKPAFNPAMEQSAAGQMEQMLKTLKMGLFVAAPGLVESYDRTLMRAVIRPALMAKTSAGESLEQDFIYNVPVRFCGGGGYAANLPLVKGDTGWLIFCDRDISGFKNSRAVVPCNTNRMHAQEDAFFLPDAMQTVSVAQEDAGRAVFQTLDGSNKISIGQSDMRINTTALTVNAAESITFNTPEVTLSGTLTVSGLVKSLADVMAKAISLFDHTHGGVTSGGSSTGGPQ